MSEKYKTYLREFLKLSRQLSAYFQVFLKSPNKSLGRFQAFLKSRNGLLKGLFMAMVSFFTVITIKGSEKEATGFARIAGARKRKAKAIHISFQ